MENIKEHRKQSFIKKFWAKKVRIETGQVVTLAELFAHDVPVSKHIYVQEYAQKKINGCYAKINPKTYYSIEFKDGFSRDVPKIIYDSIAF